MDITFNDKIVSIDFKDKPAEYKFFKLIFDIGLDVSKNGIEPSKQFSPGFEKDVIKILNKERDGLLLVKTDELVYGIEAEALVFILSMAESYLLAWHLTEGKNEIKTKSKIKREKAERTREFNRILQRECSEILRFLKEEIKEHGEQEEFSVVKVD